jgi:hypothetical protein
VSSVLKASFLNRQGSNITAYDALPVASSINLNRDARQFSGTFDLSMQLTAAEAFPVKSHDFVEFYFDLPTGRFQVGTGFLEDTIKETGESSYTIKANGREHIGQLVNIPFNKGFIFKQEPLVRFIPRTLINTYLSSYAAFRNLGAPLVNLNAFVGPIQFVANGLNRRGAVIQEGADLSCDLVFQDRLGRVVIYGRKESGGVLDASPAMGTLINGSQKSNVQSLTVRQTYSKVVSQAIVFWTSAQANVEEALLSSNLFKNTDPRSKEIYQPEMKTFSATDLQALAGGVAAETRIAMVAKSIIRKSNQNLNQVVITTPDPYYTDPVTGAITPFETLQNWQIQSTFDGLDLLMTLVGINYQQSESGLEIQLAFVEPDTLV